MHYFNYSLNCLYWQEIPNCLPHLNIDTSIFKGIVHIKMTNLLLFSNHIPRFKLFIPNPCCFSWTFSWPCLYCFHWKTKMKKTRIFFFLGGANFNILHVLHFIYFIIHFTLKLYLQGHIVKCAQCFRLVYYYLLSSLNQQRFIETFRLTVPTTGRKRYWGL